MYSSLATTLSNPCDNKSFGRGKFGKFIVKNVLCKITCKHALCRKYVYVWYVCTVCHMQLCICRQAYYVRMQMFCSPHLDIYVIDTGYVLTTNCPYSLCTHMYVRMYFYAYSTYVCKNWNYKYVRNNS